jgi:hypothetical protein
MIDMDSGVPFFFFCGMLGDCHNMNCISFADLYSHGDGSWGV